MFVVEKRALGRMGKHTVGNQDSALKLIEKFLYIIQCDGGSKTRLYYGQEGDGKKKTR